MESGGLQQSTLEYPGLSKDKIAEELDRFYRGYYMRPKPILRIIKTMLEDKDMLVRRTREGFEFFKELDPAQSRPRRAGGSGVNYGKNKFAIRTIIQARQ